MGCSGAVQAIAVSLGVVTDVVQTVTASMLAAKLPCGLLIPLYGMLQPLC